jgi:hypothetical protein
MSRGSTNLARAVSNCVRSELRPLFSCGHNWSGERWGEAEVVALSGSARCVWDGTRWALAARRLALSEPGEADKMDHRVECDVHGTMVTARAPAKGEALV